MTPERWRQVRELFERLAECAPAELAAELERAGASDPELRREVESLLALAGEAAPFLEHPAVPPTDRPTSSDEAIAPPVDSIGAYRIVRELGHGGMGTVYLAARAGGDFAQRVAIKRIRRGMDSELVVERFLAERRILAALEHPNIARLYDGGTTEEGQPYFVMEYVDGESLLAYCDSRRLPIRARLELFGLVCRAVQYAHQRLVVHRDLKPGNILVTADGVPKLLDFGLSRVLSPDGSAEPGTPTALGLRMLTPEYASPEQVRGEIVTTASDVYSLGVLLFELLTGRRPYRIRSRSAAELERAIGETEAERPSTAAARSGEIDTPSGPATLSAEAASEARDASVAQLRRALAGDLDNIVLRALKKEPERRYASAGELAEDVRRHLSGLPVLARPDTFSYRAAKFARRNAAALTAGAAVVVLLAALAVVHTAQLEKERRQTEVEATQAKQLSAFLLSLFELSDLDRTKGAKLTAREILDRGAARIESDLAGQPEVAARMTQLIAGVYERLDLDDVARPMLERALAARRALHGELSLETAECERQLAALLHGAGEEEEAEKLLRRAILTQSELEPEGVALARSRGTLANVLKRQGDYAGATAEFQAALALVDRTPPPDEKALAKTLGNYGLFLVVIGDAAKGAPYLRRTIEIEDRLLGAESPSAGGNRLNLGIALRESGDFASAIALEREALAIYEKAFGREHTDYARVLNELGSSFLGMGDFAQAEASYRAALPLYERVLGAQHPDTLGARRNLAIALAMEGRNREALPLFEEVLAERERRFGPDHPAVAESLYDVANVRRALGEMRGVEALMRRGLAIGRKTLPADSGDLAAALTDLGTVLCGLHQALEGRSLLEEAAAIVRRAPTSWGPQPEALDRSIRDCHA